MEWLIVSVLVVVLLAGAAVFVLKRRSDLGPVSPVTEEFPQTSGPETEEFPETRIPTGIAGRLSKTRRSLSDSLSAVFGYGSDAAQWERLEDALVLADVGPRTAADIVDEVKKVGADDEAALHDVLRSVLVQKFGERDRSLSLAGAPAAVVVVGVNGAGKTTTIAKLASELTSSGTTVSLGAADTFRAAADSQLKVWADRLAIPIETGAQGSDPAAVAYSAIAAARDAGTEVVIVDTAGRLHAHTNLMEELGKIGRVVSREVSAKPEVLLVLDGSTGQNGISQARAFTEAIEVTGAVVTKLDGTSKGGVAVAVETELGIPIKYIGLGEGIDDLIPFDPVEFVEALVGS